MPEDVCIRRGDGTQYVGNAALESEDLCREGACCGRAPSPRRNQLGILSDLSEPHAALLAVGGEMEYKCHFPALAGTGFDLVARDAEGPVAALALCLLVLVLDKGGVELDAELGVVYYLWKSSTSSRHQSLCK